MKKTPVASTSTKEKPEKPAGTKKVRKQTSDSRRPEPVQDWESVFRAIGTPAVILAPDHAILAANAVTCRMTGKTEAELRGIKCWEVFHGPGAESPPPGCPMAPLLASGKHETAEMEVAINDGVFLVSCTPCFDAQGTISSIIHLATDITEEKEAERMLQESEDRLKQIFLNSPLGMALVTPDFRFFSVNPAWVSMTGYTEKELLKMSFKDITHPDHLAGDPKHILELAAGKIPVYITEKRYIRKDRSILRGLLKMTAIRDRQGSLRHFAAQIEDITERKRAELDLVQKNRELVTINQLAIEFASLSSGKSVTELAVKKLMQLSGGVMVSFSVYDPAERVLQITNFDITPGMLEKTARLLGRRPVGLKIPVSPGTYKEIITHIVGIKKTITEVTFGEIPPLLGNSIQKLTGIDHFIGIAYVVEGELYGTSMLAMKHGQTDPPASLLESFAHIVAISLRRYQAEANLSEREQRYRNIIADTQAGYFQINTEGKFISVNPAWLRMHGFSSETEVIGKPFSITQVDTDRQAAQEIVKHLLHGEKISQGEFSRRRKDGSVGYHLFSASPMTKEGKIVGFEGFLIDITDRKLIEDALRESEEKYRNLYRHAAIGIFHSTPEGRFIDVNPALARMLGYTSPEEVITTITSIAGQVYADPPQYDTVTTAVLDAGGIAEVENRYRRRDGSPWYGMLHVRSVLDHEGRPGQFEGFVEDITRRKLAEQQREELITELEKKNAELERFTYTVSHDLKSPLITIRGFLGLLGEDIAKGDIPMVEGDISRILSATGKMQFLLDDLLMLSRIGRIANPPEKIPFGTIAGEAAELLQGPIQQLGVTVEIAPGLPEVVVDRTRIREVLANLIENAIKYRGERSPVITIGMRSGDDQPVFFVQDNGMGIEPQNFEKVFGLFTKLDTSSEGTGIGLAIVQRIIEIHGGRIWVESDGPGTGSTFCSHPSCPQKQMYI
jgi:two-component system sensor kinase FixL